MDYNLQLIPVILTESLLLSVVTLEYQPWIQTVGNSRIHKSISTSLLLLTVLLFVFTLELQP